VSEIAAAAAGGNGITIEEVTKTENDSGMEVRSTSANIKTVDDLIRHIGADMTKFEIAQSQGTTWEGLTADKATGEPIVTQLHRVFVKLRPKAGPSVAEAVDLMIQAAKKDLRRHKVKRHKKPPKDTLWGVIDLADLHFGGKSWRHMTGADYDLSIASRLVRDTASRLLSRSPDVGRRSIVLAGDIMHYDTISGTTTGGTIVDRDSRLPKTLDETISAIKWVIEESADDKPTEVVVVPGNHDSAMAWTIQKILAEKYENDGRVTVNTQYTSRKYLTHGKNLIGVTHGDKAKKRLAGLMALEAADLWSHCTHREWHTGHLHHQAAEVSTIDGVIIRTLPTIVPSDNWHTEMGFIGAERAMQGFVYSPEGGLHELHMEYVKA
jgi:UDP-2,3-diacylglucosamine pyrophosphatase LpxH